MAERQWTESQRDAISARRGTVLVAAAAGSGKTAVLVQRAIERLTGEDPTPADRLLIVTFTKAAAAEMRARLERQFSQLLRQRPGDPVLRRQSLLLNQAKIGTVDSFCAEVIREFFHELDLSPDFQIVSDKQEEDLTGEALNEALAEAFEKGTALELADAFAGERDDRRLMEMVLTLYRFTQSHPFPERWLREKAELYEKGDCSLWEQVILEYARETAEHCAALCAAGAQAARSDGGPVGDAFLAALEADGREFRRLEELSRKGDWDAAAGFLRDFSACRRGKLTGFEEDPLRLRLEAVRKEVKRAAEELGKYLAASRERCAEELRAAAPLVASLVELTLDFSRRYDEKKRAKNFLDYSDLEHYAIRLFLTPEGERTRAAEEVAARFDEIMIDEYQDINEVQDSLFRAVSRKGDNLFMVGDVKQSIYGFRRAMPEIFLGRRRSFQKYDRERDQYPAYLVLDRNFRSRREVTDSVNFVFSRLMSQAAGDVDYTGEERLSCGADYPPQAGCETEVRLLSRPSGVPAEAAEGAWLAERIRSLVEGGFSVWDGERQRPARYGDFCILLRSANKYAHAYAQELQRRGVPARATVTGGFFAAAETGVMLSLLRVIDNPNQDIPLLSVLMSPIYGFSAEDAARLREDSRNVPVYLSLTKAAETDPRCQRVVREIGQYRDLAATMPADAFLTLLYQKTDFTDLVLAMENGGDRIQNLRLLQAYAREYESSGYHGISGFVRFLDRLSRNGSDLQSGEAPPDHRDAVSVMSIHKSKGLEFPVCIVAGCGRNFASDQRADVLLHPRLGLGIKLKDPKRSARFTTTAREAIALETARSAAAEELRVLYVAMTRAKEKLILVGSGEHLDRSLRKLALEVTEHGISPYTVRRAKNAAQWLMLCGLCHPDGGALRELAGAGPEIVCREDAAPWKIALSEFTPPEEAAEPKEEERAAPDLALYERLKARTEFVYPYSGALGIPAKVAASKLAAEQGGRREGSLSRPAWMGEKGMTPAERGIALHEFMQFADFAAAAVDPEAELARLVREAYLTPEQGEAVDLGKVRDFLAGPLGRRVLASQEVERERRFTAVLPASLVEPDRPDSGEEVILQGAIDCTFVEDGLLHIIDFKTDRVGSMEELWERYGAQLRLYGAAMGEIDPRPVGELILYSTQLSQGDARRYQP